MNTGTFFIGSTPIGNPEDFTLRLIRLLKECDLLVVENASKIFSFLDLNGIEHNKNYLEYRDADPLEDLDQFEYTKDRTTRIVIRYLDENKNVLFISDEGTPLVSDPGFDIINRVAHDGYNIQVVPGPSALLATLIHGLSLSDPKTKQGFIYLPIAWTEEDIKKALDPIKNSKQSIIMTINNETFLSSKTAKHFLSILGNRGVAICQDLTCPTQRIITSDLENLDGVIKGQEDFLSTQTTILIYPEY